jgi:alpha-L-rhamnosidase
MFGSPSQWCFKALAGINTVKGHPGYARSLVAPPPPGAVLAVSNLTGVAASVSTPHGELAVGWAVAHGRYVVNVTIPFGTRATVAIPVAEGCPVFGGVPNMSFTFTRTSSLRGAATVVEVGSGVYSFWSPCT